MIPTRHSRASNSQLPRVDGTPLSHLSTTFQTLHWQQAAWAHCGQRGQRAVRGSTAKESGWLAAEPTPILLCQRRTHRGKATVMQRDQSREK